jgi:chemotaxis protein CheD
MEAKIVRVAHAETAIDGEVLAALGLGSCVAVLLHDRNRGVGGMAHVLLPDPRASGDAGNPAKYAKTAVPHLIGLLEEAGAEPAELVARLVGGASMFGPLLSPGRLNTGERNLVAARRALASLKLPVIAEDVGGEHGRSVYFYAESGRVMVKSFRYGEVEL